MPRGQPLLDERYRPDLTFFWSKLLLMFCKRYVCHISTDVRKVSNMDMPFTPFRSQQFFGTALPTQPQCSSHRTGRDPHLP